MKPIFAVPATLALVYRAWSRKSLTPAGIVAAALTATVHAFHPWSVFFVLLVVFYLAGTTATKVKHDIKARLTLSATGASGGEGARGPIQVLANSITASVLILLHAWTINDHGPKQRCWAYGASDMPGNILVAGIIANYAAVASDTLSSELGILSKSKPRLITAPWRVVPPGTNGGVTPAGLLAGLAGSALISFTAVAFVPFCASSDLGILTSKQKNWTSTEKIEFGLLITALGFCGTLLDSLLGALLQASVVDVRTGKVVEGDGGKKVLVHTATKNTSANTGSNAALKSRGSPSGPAVVEPEHHESRKIEVGTDILSNNGVNLVMAASISLTAMIAFAWRWEAPLAATK